MNRLFPYRELARLVQYSGNKFQIKTNRCYENNKRRKNKSLIYYLILQNEYEIKSFNNTHIFHKRTYSIEWKPHINLFNYASGDGKKTLSIQKRIFQRNFKPNCFYFYYYCYYFQHSTPIWYVNWPRAPYSFFFLKKTYTHNSPHVTTTQFNPFTYLLRHHRTRYKPWAICPRYKRIRRSCYG